MNDNKNWNIQFTNDDHSVSFVKNIAEQFHISTIIAKLLYNRSIRDASSVGSFLQGGIEQMNDPFLMKDMQKAVLNVEKAIANQERICIYGDYDVDGITSVTLLYLYIQSRGGNVEYFIPTRTGNGYGLSNSAIDALYSKGIKWIITVDTGITAIDEIQYANEQGMNVIVTDHHACASLLPMALAVINPHRPDCDYPFKELAGVGVVFKFVIACEMARTQKTQEEVLENIGNLYYDLVTVGTIADVMPLLGENRFIVKQGLSLLNSQLRMGFDELVREIEMAKKRGGFDKSADIKKDITSSYISFQIAPRMNAAGRISDASKSVELLLANSCKKAHDLAMELCQINIQRQEEETRTFDNALLMLRNHPQLLDDYVLVLDSDEWMQGVIGIVASKLTEKFGKPTILISFDGEHLMFDSANDMGHGSGRSVKGMDLVKALSGCHDLLERYGGHELAAGLTVSRKCLNAFRERINVIAKQEFNNIPPEISILVDCQISFDDINLDFYQELLMMEPFGTGNSTPTFVLSNVLIDEVHSIGNGKHTKIIFSDSNGKKLTGIWFNKSDIMVSCSAGEQVDVVFQLALNDYLNVKSVQMNIMDIRQSLDFMDRIHQLRTRYKDISNGHSFHSRKEIIPTRDDLKELYLFLKNNSQCGKISFWDYDLCRKLHRRDNDYPKIRLMLDILEDMEICVISQPEEGLLLVELSDITHKSLLENTATYQRLLTQYHPI